MIFVNVVAIITQQLIVSTALRMSGISVKNIRPEECSMSFSYFLHRIFIFCLLICISSIIHAQNIYELGKLSEDDWLSMSTEDRLNSLGKANKYAQNQTFLGDFGKHYDQYKRWGYEF